MLRPVRFRAYRAKLRDAITLTQNSLPFKDFYKEFIIRNPEKGRFFRVQVSMGLCSLV